MHGFDTPVILKQDQDHQTWYDLIEPKQGYNHAKFERPPLNSIRKKMMLTVLSNQETCQLSPLNMCASKK